MSGPRITVPTLKVLQALLETDSGRHVYGLQLMELTGLKSGTLYPVLARLESAGWISSAWEKVDPKQVKRPRRRYYQLTGLGEQAATAELAVFSASRRRAPSTPSARPAWGQA